MAVVAELVIKADTTGADRFVAKMNEAQQASRRSLGAMNADIAKSASTFDSINAAAEKYRANSDLVVSSQERVRSANAQLVSSQEAVASGANSMSRSLVDTASGILTTVAHFKLLAVVAYAMSPAFRSIVAGGVTTTLGLIGANAGIASAAMSRLVAVASPALAFLTRLTIPITIAVAAFKLFNDTVERGSALLDKYGGVAAQRKLFGGAGVDEALAKLTKFQDADLSAQQVEMATQLGSRLETAKNEIADFLKVQLDLTDPALKLQNAWVVIVEYLAKALTLAGQIPDAFGKGAQAVGNSSVWDKIPSWFKVSPEQEKKLVSQLNENYGPAPEPSAEEAMKAARSRLAAGMGGGFNKRFGDAISDLANPPKAETPDAPSADKADVWNRAVDSVNKHIAAMQADADAVGLAVGEHARLRTEAQLTEALLNSGIEINDEYAKTIDKLAESAAAAAQGLEKAKVAADIKFSRDTMFLSDQDVQIAQKLKGLYGDDIPAALASTQAAQMRVTNGLKDIKDVLMSSTGGFRDYLGELRKGTDGWKAMGIAGTNALTRIEDKMADIVEKKLLEGIIGTLLGGTTGGASGGAGLIGAIFGLGGGAPKSTAWDGKVYNANEFNPIDATVGHEGGMIGAPGMPSRYVHPAYFENAPRFHSGGVVPGEVPVIAKPGEVIGYPNQMAQAYGGVHYAPTIVVDARGANMTEGQIKAIIAPQLAESEKRLHATIPAKMAQQQRGRR